MKKLIPLFLAVFAAAVVSWLAWLAFANNVAAVVNWWSDFIAAGGDSAGLAAKTARGFIPWLDWSVVDYSAVTTFIPALGFTCMALALGRLIAGRRTRAAEFPFFKGSDQLNVALGLFGTLWGIIVIGYFNLDTVSMADLMQCLHTALFSTLMAVVWVFMIDRPLVRPWFCRILARSGLEETDDGDLAQAVGVRGRVRAAAGGIREGVLRPPARILGVLRAAHRRAGEAGRGGALARGVRQREAEGRGRGDCLKP